MQNLLKKIEAAADARLLFPPGTTPVEKLARYKTYLKVETHRLKLLHRAGEAGNIICRARVTILDALLKHFWAEALEKIPGAKKETPPVALVAIGGFGRAELNPHSDIDFMFLHEGLVSGGKPQPPLSELFDGILYPLWDLGFKVGYSVRDIDDCIKVANTDMQSKTSLIESRLVIGDEALFKKFQAAVVAKCVVGYESKYIAARMEDQATRRSKHGNSACMQEPNIKNGCGGLRDFQNLLWMSFFKYRTRSLADLQEREFITPAERKQLEAAYEFLLRVRTEMHYHLNRQQDVLGKNIQPAVAHNLGYTDRSPSKRIEKFMRDLYVHMRNVFLTTRTLEQRMVLLSPAQTGKISKIRSLLPAAKPRPLPEPVDGFIFVDDEIRAANNRIFRDSPRRLMRVFLHAQQRHLRLHPDLAQLIRSQISLVDREFLNDEHVRETFLTILEKRGEVGPALRAMHEVNLLGKYIPEFGKLTCLVQHEFYHQYAADEHTLVCIEQLDRIWEAKEPPFKYYEPIFQGLERPGLLYLALLLHDVGKGAKHEQGKHADVGAALALRAARRLNLDEGATGLLKFLVENHLAMASISQRRDLDDSAVIRDFSRLVGTPERLSQLMLLTFADSQGTSDKLWSGFKDSLLWQLHNRSAALLAGGTEFRKANEQARGELRDLVRELAPSRISDEEVAAHFAALPQRYFEIHTAKQIQDDLELAHRFMHRLVAEGNRALVPATAWIDERDRGYSLVKVCTWDRAGLFGKIAGTLSAAGLNILGAQIFTRNDGIALDTFFVNDGRTGALAERDQRERFSELLEKVLTGENVDLPRLIARRAGSQPHYTAYFGERIETHLHLDNDASEGRTLIEIETEDRLGLLHAISQTLAELRLDISAARIATERGAALDSFYVREIGGAQVNLENRGPEIETALRAAIGQLEAFV
ncbi:MAG TPA: [protein-PII] uridylyltransferase [Candidatus Sulfotelmatobacter sp.]|nr:[protein-PII] uridylyltransferase [Candidatus Sulfotelmatobacter sp.]